MVIIITGASHTGKTMMAQKMLEIYKYPYLSIDHLKMGLIRSNNTNLTAKDDDKLTIFLWPIVKEMIKTAIENNQNMIFEGCYIPFNWRDDFTSFYLKSIRFVCLAFSDKYIDNHFNDIKKYNSVIEARINDDYCTIDKLKNDNQFVIEGYKKVNEDIVIIDDKYEESIEKIMKMENNNG